MDKKINKGSATGSATIAGGPADHWMRRVAYEKQYRSATAPADATPRRSDLSDRAEPRKTTPFTALVNYGLTYSVPWHVRDLSPTGAFVEMNASDVPQGSFVEFVLRFPYKDHHVEHRLPAKVVRVEPNGVALEFGEYDDAAYTDIVNLLYAA